MCHLTILGNGKHGRNDLVPTIGNNVSLGANVSILGDVKIGDNVVIGADAVVNHHQHCYSGYEHYNGKPIVYGLGNFCFDWKDKSGAWNEGYLASLDIVSEKISLELTPYNQCGKSSVVKFIEGEQRKKFFVDIEHINATIADDNLLEKNFDEWCNSRSQSIQTIFNSHHNRYLNFAARKGWIKRPASRKELLAELNYIVCEAHRDVTLNVLNNTLKKNG